MSELDAKRGRLAKEKREAERRKERHGPGSESGWLDRRAAEKERAEEIGAELRAVDERRQKGRAWLEERFPQASSGPREALRRDVGERLHEMPEAERGKLPEQMHERADALASGHAERLQREQQKAMEQAMKEASRDLGRPKGRDRGRDRGMGMGM